jgi:hypothetical protein
LIRKTLPHLPHLAKATTQRAAMITRLARLLPRGEYLRQLAQGLVFGKIGHALAATATPMLTAETLTTGGLKTVRIALNNVARSVTGCKCSDHVTVSELNSKAKFALLNELVAQTVAMETWAAFHSSKGSARGRNPLGVKMFESSGFTRESRATAAGKVTDRASGSNTLVSSGLRVLNTCSDLRTARTKGAARRAANSFARGAPL